MSFLSAQKSRLMVGDFALATKLTSVKSTWNAAMLDTTVLTDTAKTFIPGQDTSTLAMQGFYDELMHVDEAAWFGGQQPITYGPSGLALNSEVWLYNAFETTFESGAAVADTVQFTLAAQTSGPSVPGVSLHDLTAETADINATANDFGAVSTTNGAIAHIHVTAFSGFSGVVFTIADSANNSTFATIGTFATVAGVTTERIAIAGTVRRYVRVQTDVTGSGSVTFACAIARL